LARLASHVAVLAEQRIVEFGPQEEIMAGDHPLVTAFRGGK
jgi:phospholipid/cholesterol/gamma-HCH transport system ATP-binding protein